MFIRKNVTTRPIQCQIICITCIIVLLFTLLMFLAPLRSVTPSISMRRCREEILSSSQLSLSVSACYIYIYMCVCMCEDITYNVQIALNISLLAVVSFQLRAVMC